MIRCNCYCRVTIEYFYKQPLVFSSYDEIQQVRAKIPNVPVRHSRKHNEQKNVSDFESDIDEELTIAFTKHTNNLLNKGDMTLEKATSSKSAVKSITESQIDPSLGLGDNKTDSDDGLLLLLLLCKR